MSDNDDMFVCTLLLYGWWMMHSNNRCQNKFGPNAWDYLVASCFLTSSNQETGISASLCELRVKVKRAVDTDSDLNMVVDFFC